MYQKSDRQGISSRVTDKVSPGSRGTDNVSEE